MKFSTLFLSIVFIGGSIGMNSSASAGENSMVINDLVLQVRDSNENLHNVSKEDITYVQMLLNDNSASTSIDENKFNSNVKAILMAVLKECAEKIASVEKKENNLKFAGFSGFFVSAILAVICGFDLLPHVSNERVNHHLHSKDTQAYALLISFPLVFYALYKAQGYQNERITLQEIEERIGKLKEALSTK